MYATAIIVFREFLEVALILGVLLAATKSLPGRWRWFGIGIGAGVVGSAAVAFATDWLAGLAEGMGQEIFNGIILLLAALMISWTVIWMKQHGREIAMQAKRVGQEVVGGTRGAYALSLIIFFAILREGSEIVLFTYSQLASGEVTLGAVLIGSLIGGAVGILVGTLLYLGLLQIPTRYLFSFTSALLVLLAGGLIAQAIGFFGAAGIMPELASPVWDTSHILSQETAFGQVLHVLLGYIDRPTGMQALCYGATILLLAAALKLVDKKLARQRAVAH